MAAPPVLFVFVISDPTVASGVMDFVTGKTAAAQAAVLATVSAQTEGVLQKAQAIDTTPPSKPPV
jgi:hypothetical protein